MRVLVLGGAGAVCKETTRDLAQYSNVGIPLSIGAQLIAHGQVTGEGVLPPGRAFPTEPFFAELAKRGILMEEEIVEEGTLA
jgi:hypothetical protein